MLKICLLLLYTKSAEESKLDVQLIYAETQKLHKINLYFQIEALTIAKNYSQFWLCCVSKR